jgi:anionic cell wall polymer biosynthesis LytR-Cps2A-Psr (LCP) family protein
MVDAIGGIHLYFRDPLKDTMSGLNVPKTGCQLVHGGRALALVRSRHLQYEVGGVWYNDYGSDFTRIHNQQAFFRAVIHQLNSQITNPFALNDFIGAATHNLTIDQTLTEGTLVKLAGEFHNFPPGSLKSETLPTVGPYITSGGAEVLLPAAGPDEAMIAKFLAFGASLPKGSTTTSTTKPGGTGASTSTTVATQNKTTVTTVAQAPAGETPIYNTQSQPYDPVPC